MRNIATRVKLTVTKRLLFAYLLIALPLVLLLAILVDTVLYAINPLLLPPPIIRFASLYWTILVGLIGGMVVLLASKRFLDSARRVYHFLQDSLPTRRLKFIIGVASLITALLYPCSQVVASYYGPQRTAIPNTPYSGSVLLKDPLTTNSLGWKALPSPKSSCTFTNAGYEVLAKDKKTRQLCLAHAASTYLHDFALQVEMTMKVGAVGGILFRDRYLLTLIGNSYAQGSFDLEAMIRDGNVTELLPSCYPFDGGCFIGESVAPEQTVTITVIARGTTLEVYIDMLRVKTLTNGVSAVGGIGLFAEIANGQPDAYTDVLFSNLSIWTDVV